MKGNEEIRQLKCHLAYDHLVAAADDFSAIFADAKDTLEKIRKLAAAELQDPTLPLCPRGFLDREVSGCFVLLLWRKTEDPEAVQC